MELTRAHDAWWPVSQSCDRLSHFLDGTAILGTRGWWRKKCAAAKTGGRLRRDATVTRLAKLTYHVIALKGLAIATVPTVAHHVPTFKRPITLVDSA